MLILNYYQTYKNSKIRNKNNLYLQELFGASNQTLKLIIQGEIGYAASETCTTNNDSFQTWIHEIVHSWKNNKCLLATYL